jgi:DNA-directed RNA polymerase alpha subunit
MQSTDKVTIVLVGVEHLPDCTPLRPCKSCVAAKFLRMNMDPEAFAAFVTLMTEEPMPEAPVEPKKWYDQPFDTLGRLSVRAHNALKNDNIVTISDLVSRTEGEMLRFSHFGRKSLNEVKELLSTHGLHLAMTLPERPPPGLSKT